MSAGKGTRGQWASAVVWRYGMARQCEQAVGQRIDTSSTHSLRGGSKHARLYRGNMT